MRPVSELVGQVVIMEDGGPVLGAELMGKALGLAPAALRAALDAGLVYSLVERGEAEDAGRHRLTLRHRATEAVLVVDANGQIMAAQRRGPA